MSPFQKARVDSAFGHPCRAFTQQQSNQGKPELSTTARSQNPPPPNLPPWNPATKQPSPIYGGSGGRRAGPAVVAPLDLPPPPGHEQAPHLGGALPRRLRRAALLLLEPAGVRARLVLRRGRGLGGAPGRVARRALRLRHVRRRLRAALHGRRAGRRRARHARHLDHRARAAGVRGQAPAVAGRRGAPRHGRHRAARAPRAALRGQRRRRRLRRRQLRRAPLRPPRPRRRRRRAAADLKAFPVLFTPFYLFIFCSL
ncbi:hypothetical protein ACQJBY_049965 [Aegilops geniculata]